MLAAFVADVSGGRDAEYDVVGVGSGFGLRVCGDRGESAPRDAGCGALHAGGSESVTRAQLGGLQALGLSAIVLLLINPADLFDVGAQLVFSAVAVIFVMSDWIAERTYVSYQDRFLAGERPLIVRVCTEGKRGLAAGGICLEHDDLGDDDSDYDADVSFGVASGVGGECAPDSGVDTGAVCGVSVLGDRAVVSGVGGVGGDSLP